MNTSKLNIYVLTIICLIGSIYLLINPNDVEAEYKERGIPVVATVYEINQHIGKKTQDYTCYYLDDNGERVYATLVLNKMNGNIGDKVQGAYLPESPNYVYCEASKGLKFASMALLYGFTLILLICSIASFMPKKDEDEVVVIRNDVESSVTDANSIPFESHKISYASTAEESAEIAVHNNSEIKSSTGLKLKL